MDGVKKITEEDRATRPNGRIPMDAAALEKYERYKRYKENTCRVLIEGSGPRGEQLGEFIREHLSQVPRVEALINSEPGGMNPLLSDEARPDIPNARAPSHVVLVKGEDISQDVPEGLPSDTTEVMVSLAIFRPKPFVCMLQYFSVMPSTALYEFAAKVATYVQDCQSNGITDSLKQQDAMFEAVIETMRQEYILPE